MEGLENEGETLKHLGLFFVFFLLLASPLFAGQMIEDFSELPVGKFPSNFKTHPFQKQKAMKVYKVAEEGGRHYLKAVDNIEAGVSIFRHDEWDMTKFPYVSWSWRAQALPVNGGTGDNACGIYFIFGGYSGNSIKYLWSTNIPLGKVETQKAGKFYTVALESGPEKLGKWQNEEVNLAEEYKKLFKTDTPLQPKGFAILTDGDDTHSLSACDYTDFKISESASTPPRGTAGKQKSKR